MKRMLFNATQAEELRVAIVDGQNLLDLDIETLGKEQRKGNIYKGIITRIEPSLEACFVDYGTDRHGFLPFKEVSRAYFQDYDGGRARIQDVLQEGMQVIVQVEKDERGNKGAALTTFISLAGRYLVLMPNNPRGGGISRRIEGEERQELKAAMSQLDVPHGMSLIARTAGIGRSVEELQWDFNYLLQLWRAIEEAGNAHQDPYLLFMESSLLIRAIRDHYRSDIGEILIDNREVFGQVQEFMSYVMPHNVGKLKYYDDHIPLFSRFQIEHQIESAFSRSVSLPSGGAIVIDHTEALVSVDVNSARSTRGADIEETAFQTNMEAAEEVARQMRLRDLGGLIVIDFIDMENPKHQRDVENTLRDALRKDRARVQMGKLSRFGLLELSRQRLRPSLGESSHVACPRCAGTGVIRGIESTALHVLRIIQEEAMKDNTEEVHAQVPVDVATFLLNEKRAELFGLEERLDVSILMIPNTHLENPHYNITRVRPDDVDDDAEPSYKQVEIPEEDDSQTLEIGRQAKPVKPEPAVKGIKHSSPAPIVQQPAEPGLLAGIGAWFAKLFGGGETKPAEAPAANNGRNGGNRSKAQQNRNRRNRGQQRGQNGNNRPSRQQAADDAETLDNRAPQQPAEKSAAEQQPNPRQRRRQRKDSDVQVASAENDKLQAAGQAADIPERFADETGNYAENQERGSERGERERNNERGERNERRSGRDRRQDNGQRNGKGRGRQRNIPSAQKIIQYLDIPLQAELVKSAADVVLGLHTEAPAPVPQPDEADNDKPLVITIPEVADEADAPTFVFAEENTAEAVEAAEAVNPAAVASPAVEAAQEEAVVVETVAVATSSAETQAAPEAATVDDSIAAAAQAVEMASAAVVQPTQPTAAEPAVADLGGLVLVQTDPAALTAVQPEPEQPKGLRRADVTPAAPATVPEPQQLQQVETYRS
ncbi:MULTISPECIES: Rne/Rng family ribonuclease [Eikenella]|uniref:Ribonuclease E n=1 Tax=Eikenella exigua TaxID=2528037 RepID=A0AAX1F609_9NEIS|nr:MULTISPECIES: Rne/Rng family ribonuclease [Eikenella]OAM28048.1 ribonuclease E [Eikenella sp. NML01-A-086]OAM42835.1 ribonuclease E [Eikenella sp. NML97-A-109]QED91528.1 Rne/Rng family ribonuclease [Eikenella exigua]